MRLARGTGLPRTADVTEPGHALSAEAQELYRAVVNYPRKPFGFRASAGLALRDVLRNSDAGLHPFITRLVLDVVVMDRAGCPVLAFEFHGPRHFGDAIRRPLVEMQDMMKARLLAGSNIRLFICGPADLSITDAMRAGFEGVE